jgi:DNA-binding LacI/PurR family transcriptional regulator
MAANIHDVARHADVSITTVSHVLSGRGRVAASTQERVRRAIAELGYQANIHAQRLASQKSRTLAFQIASFTDTASSNALVPNSNYFLEVLNAAASKAMQREYVLLILSAQVDASILDRYGVDGVLIIDPRGDEPIFQTEIDPSWLIVTNGRIAEERSHIGIVDNDHRRTARQALEHLQEQGYERPALITTDLGRSYTRDVAVEYTEWCAQHGIEATIIELEEPPTQDAAADAMRTLLEGEHPPDAVFVSAEDLALGALHAAQSHGLEVPRDLGIVSAVDSSVLLLTTPAISAVFLDPLSIGETAVDLLISALDEQTPFPTYVEVPSELRIRDSTNRKGMTA